MENNLLFAHVIIDLNTNKINQSFTYRVPDDLVHVLKIGDAVKVPFGKSDKERNGYIINIQTLDELKQTKFYQNNKFFTENENAIYETKFIKKKAEKNLSVNEILIKIAIFMAKEYNTSLSLCLKKVLLSKKEIRKNKEQTDTIEKYLDKTDEDTDIILNEEQNKIVEDLIKKYEKNEFSESLIFGVIKIKLK